MATVITGGSGLIGSAVLRLLPAVRLTYTRTLQAINQWNADNILCPALENAACVIHLSGANIAAKLWTKARKEELVRSRVHATRLLVSHILRLKHPPPLFLQASAIGFYGQGFLADLCHQWEEASRPLEGAGIRVVRLRFANVLSPQGGILKALLPLLRLKILPTWGKEQWFSWVSLHDAARAVVFARDCSGFVDVCADALSLQDFFSALSRHFHTKWRLHVPDWALRLLPGHMGDELFLANLRSSPNSLQEQGFRFHQPTVEKALPE